MLNRSLFWPLSLLGVFAALALLLFSGVLSSPRVVQGQTCSYPDRALQQECFARETSEAGGNTSYPGAEPAQMTETPTTTTTLRTTGTPARAGTSIATVTGITQTSISQPNTTLTTTATSPVRQVQSPLPTATATARSALDGLERLLCQPGSTVTITGTVEGSMALLAFFDSRPVGGSFARSDGQYSITLSIGPERPGTYAVEVRERDGLAVVQRLACEVPGATPTTTLVPGITPTATFVRGP
jgi:hypothetical protein